MEGKTPEESLCSNPVFEGLLFDVVNEEYVIRSTALFPRTVLTHPDVYTYSVILNKAQVHISQSVNYGPGLIPMKRIVLCPFTNNFRHRGNAIVHLYRTAVDCVFSKMDVELTDIFPEDFWTERRWQYTSNEYVYSRIIK